MKKTIAIVSGLTLLFSSGMYSTPIIDTSHAKVVATPKAQQNNQSVKLAATNEENVIEFTIDTFVKRGIEDNRNLTLLSLQYELLEEQRWNTISERDKQIRTINDSINNQLQPTSLGEVAKTLGKLPEGVDPKDLKEEDLDPEDLQAVLLQREINIALNNEINKQGEEQRKRVRDQFENTITQISNQRNRNSVEQREAREGVKLMLKGRYVELQGLEKGIELQEKAIINVKNELRRLEALEQNGVVARMDVNRLKREIVNQERELRNNQKLYELEIRKMKLDLNIEDNKKIVFSSLPVSNMERVITKESEQQINDLINKSFEVSKVWLSYSSSDVADIARIENKIIDEQLKDTRIKMKQNIRTLYLDEEKAFEEIQFRKQNLEYELEDYNKLRVQHHVGLLSNFELEQAKMAITQAEFELWRAQTAYYMIKEQIKAMDEGLVPIN